MSPFASVSHMRDRHCYAVDSRRSDISDTTLRKEESLLAEAMEHQAGSFILLGAGTLAVFALLAVTLFVQILFD